MADCGADCRVLCPVDVLGGHCVDQKRDGNYGKGAGRDLRLCDAAFDGGGAVSADGWIGGCYTI